MRARAERTLGHRCQLIVGGRDDHHVGFEFEQLVDAGARSAAIPPRQVFRALGDGVSGPDHVILGSQGSGSLIADQPAPDDPDLQFGLAHVYSVE